MHFFASLLILFLPSLSDGRFACDVCKETIRKVDEWIVKNGTIAEMDKFAAMLCRLDEAGGECEGPPHSWQCEEVCALAALTYDDLADYLLVRYMEPAEICYLIDQNALKCPEPPPAADPTPVPNLIVDNQTRTTFNDSALYGYFLQIPDLHWDRQYVAGSVANCGEPVCCRANDGDHNYSRPLVYGGKYGIANESILCDTPLSVISSMMDYIVSDIVVNSSDGVDRDNLDFVAFVGDANAHDVYNQSKASHLSLMRDWVDILHSAFDPFGIPVFLTLGNHEGLPVDNFNGPPTDDWYNGPISEWISSWIDTPYSAPYDSRKPSEILASSGYYSSVIRPGFRLIAINSGYIAADNFYLKFSHNKDPYVDMGGQLKWLRDTLHRAKYELNEKVVLLLHHPISSAVSPFERTYYDLYDEYGDIIVTILAGHTHSDQFHVLGNNNFSATSTDKSFAEDPNTNNPFATWFSAGSVVQYNGRNPAFRVYQYNRNTLEMVNYIHYRFDTKRSNAEGQPIWFRAYDAMTEYGVRDVSAASMTQLAYAMAVNDTLWKRYQVNNYNDVPRTGALDRNATVCDSLAATSWQFDECRRYLFPTALSMEDLERLYW